jgi:hypothetical protein
MKATVLYRIACFLLIVIAAGNTYSLVLFWRVAGALSPLYFPLGHTHITYFQAVVSLELFASLCILFGAYLAWHLSGLVQTNPQAVGAMGWVLFGYELFGVCISFMFLSGLVRILGIALAVCIGCANSLASSRHAGRHQQSEPALGQA